MAADDTAGTLHIWGRLSSINVRKVVWAARETGLPVQRTEAGGVHGIVQTPEYRRLNPNGLVPVLEHEGTTLWESNVIVRYLAYRFPEAGLWPADDAERFEAEQWMDWQQTTLNPAGRNAFVQMFRVPEAQRDHELVRASVAATEPLMALLDARLTARANIVGAASAWPTYRSPARCIAGSACHDPDRRGRTSSAGTSRCSRGPRRRESWISH